MARAFTINFTFHAEIYMAVISHSEDMLSIYFPDSVFDNFFEKGKISFRAGECIKQLSDELHSGREIIREVFKAIEINHPEVVEKLKLNTV